MGEFELPSVIINEDNAVNILTVFASKGLEYKNVFVLYKVGEPRKQNKENFVFDLSWGKKLPFGLIMKKYSNVTSPKYAIYYEYWQNPRIIAENLRLFYVAITRAEQNLRVVSFEPYSTNQKPVKYHEIFD